MHETLVLTTRQPLTRSYPRMLHGIADLEADWPGREAGRGCDCAAFAVQAYE